MGGFHRDPLLPLSFHLLFLDPYSASFDSSAFSSFSSIP